METLKHQKKLDEEGSLPRASFIYLLKTGAVALALIASTLISVSLQAQSIYLDDGILNSTVSVSIDGSVTTIPAGVWSGSIGGVNAQFFCFDISQNITVPGLYTVTTLYANDPSLPGLMTTPPTTTNANLELAAALLQSQLPMMGNNNNAAGMQLAIWSILYNSSLQAVITTGDHFFASGSPTNSLDILNAANLYLADAAGIAAGPISPSAYNLIPFFAQLNSEQQIVAGTQIIVGFTVPEPQTYMIMGSLLALIGLYSYRRQSFCKQCE